jgi:hypothetical protein
MIGEDFGGFRMRGKAITSFCHCSVNYFQIRVPTAMLGWPDVVRAGDFRFYFAI